MFDFFYRCFTHCWICLVCPLLCVHHGLQKVQYVSSVCDSGLFYQHTDLRLIIHRTFTQVGNPSQSEGSSSIMVTTEIKLLHCSLAHRGEIIE